MAKADIFTTVSAEADKPVGGYKVKVSVPEDEVEMQPGGVRTVTAQIVDQDDNPVVPENPISVTLSVAGVENSGGHIDFYHSPQTRPTGTLSAPTCTTGGDGKCQITHKAPVFSGMEDIEASITGSKDTVRVINKIAEFPCITGGTTYMKLIGQKPPHPINHCGLGVVLCNIDTIAHLYHNQFPDDDVLHINDISLPWGGKFDIYVSTEEYQSCACWTEELGAAYHEGHQRGREVDIRKGNREGGVPDKNDPDFIKICRDNGAAVTPRRDHYHLTF